MNSTISTNNAAPLPLSLSLTAQTSGMVPLLGTDAAPNSNWAVLRVHGADASHFLHNQLSNDIALLKSSAARLATWCSAKGRVIASFIIIQAQKQAVHTADTSADASADTSVYWLLCRRDLVELVIKKLRMYVLRSKVIIEDASQDVAVYGVIGKAAEELWQTYQENAESTSETQPWQCLRQSTHAGEGCLVSLYPASVLPQSQQASHVARVLCLQARYLPAPAINGQPIPSLPLAFWEWTEAASGVASIEQACTEQFVPQMLNLESVGGVSFKKGCYPGQEVVARSQFKGAIKRRGYIVTAQSSFLNPEQAFAGSEVWLVPAPQNVQDIQPAPCGTVVQSAVVGEHCIAFVSLPISDAEAVQTGNASLRLGSEMGLEVQLHPLPYTLIEV